MSARGLSIEFIIDSGNVGGAESQLVTLCQHLRAAGHDPRVLFLQPLGPALDRLRDSGIPVASVRAAPRDATAARWTAVDSARSLGAYARYGRRHRTQPDIVHSMLDGSIAVSHLLHPGTGRPPFHVAGILGRRIADTSSRDPGARLRSSMLERSLRKADAVVCNAPHLREEILDQLRLDPGRVRVIPNGVDLPDWRSDTSGQPARGVVVANFHDYKGYDVLLESLTRVTEPVTVHLCGTGDVRAEMQALAGRLGLDAMVTFVEPPADVPAELRAAQFGVHPSRTEGLSNAILEQMAAGLPVIASDVGGNPVLVEDGVNGLLVPVGDPIALAAAITTLATDPARRARMGEESRRRAASLSWDACTGAHVALYEELLGRRDAG